MPPSCLTVLPARFAYHDAAASTNAYTHTPDADADTVARAARSEAETLVRALRDAGVDIFALDERDKPGEPCPDSVFPNNWFSVHGTTLVLYPMHDEARRRERWGDLRERLTAAGVRIDEVIDLTHHERDGRALEGTGSLVFDHANRVVFAARSARTDEALAREIAQRLGYEPVLFDAHDQTGAPVYHTNVVMSVSERFAIVCLERIEQPDAVSEALTQSGRTLVEITGEQMDRFGANVIALPSHHADTILAMSRTAHDAYTDAQRAQLQRFARPVPVEIPTIERIGGGSVRCMIATLHQ